MSVDQTPVDRLADAHLARWIELNPSEASMSGLAGSETELSDFSPDGDAAQAGLLADTLSALAELAPSAAERVTASALHERLEVELVRYRAGDHLGELGPINGQLGYLRAAFDNMPTSTPDDLDTIAARLAKMPAAVANLRDGIAARFDRGRPSPIRQVEVTLQQCRTWSGEPGSGGGFADLGARRADLAPLAVLAAESIRELGAWLAADIAPRAIDADGCGADEYARAAPVSLGAQVDAVEAYAWGWTEVDRLAVEIRTTIDLILPGATFVEARDHLDAAQSIVGADAWLAWLQDLTDRTIDDLQGRYFAIDPSIARCEAMLPPDGVGAAAYYSPPSEDLRIPGRTWYPAIGRKTFPTWDIKSTVYHESVPGHHLQIGRVMIMADRLCRYRRTMFISGHGEGWALYAERLMDEIGTYADDPAGRLGFLSGQMLRACRVVIDIGLHLGLTIPDGHPHAGTRWSAELAHTMLVEQAGTSAEEAASEVDRYLAMPAQAISYKLGEREWLAARDDARRRAGSSFDLRAWHEAALDLGAIGLADLRTELAR